MSKSNDMQDKQKRLVEQMHNALSEYRADSSTAKPYFTTMKEISEWLTQKEKV